MTVYAREKHPASHDKTAHIGYCLGCAARLTFCGQPFTADIECPNCGAVNVYTHSFTPNKVKGRPGVEGVRAEVSDNILHI